MIAQEKETIELFCRELARLLRAIKGQEFFVKADEIAVAETDPGELPMSHSEVHRSQQNARHNKEKTKQ